MSSRSEIARIEMTTDESVVVGRHQVRTVAQQMGLSLLDQTRLVTAVSELGRNVIVHGRGGTMTVNRLQEEDKEGIEVIFSDNGPGIPDVKLAMTDGYSTAGSMGIGLHGAARLVDDFKIDSEVGVGTTVTIRKWI
ncbi:anti-sigma regulatory factor [Geomonas sp. RF6]|uniref:anti-sigma regulatory factor n=1 Tax=Geomonas sp. RF6 TaxID=2897342 RepID=UPI001E4B9B96|nr:anti-sigma regulatory factor [Geomonas sp. RF6]UFS69756.1 anti-sigma regulatory factor [Geomonas sp. RF6]